MIAAFTGLIAGNTPDFSSPQLLAALVAGLGGLTAGSLHVFSGPDHLAAVAPLAIKGHQQAWRTGLRWGLGHAAGVIVVGLLSLALRGMLPVELISSWSERLVGVLLIGIGCWALRKAFSTSLHTHAHAHDGQPHVHLHFHSHGHAPKSSGSHRHNHTAFGIGTLHGLAGSSHFLGVLPALAFPTREQAVTYLIAYGLGTIAAMTLFSSLIGLITGRLTAGSGATAYRVLMCLSAVSAFSIGAYWLTN